MGIDLEQFWSLAADAGLMSAEQCRELDVAYRGSGRGATAELAAKWLVEARRLTSYQAGILLSGRPGPFVFGHYVITERIRAGRLKTLFRALHRPTGNRVSLWFPGDRPPDRVFARFAASAISSPEGIDPFDVGCWEFVDAQRKSYLVLEYLRGTSLARKLGKGRIPVDRALQVAADVATALATWHRGGRVHGHVHPANVWLDRDERARLLPLPSFGKHAARRSSDATSSELAAYVAPEVAAPDVSESPRTASPQSDIYGLGCLSFHMLTGGVAPLARETASEDQLQRIRSSLIEEQADFDPQLADLVVSMLAVEPEARPQDASTLARLLSVDPRPRSAPLGQNKRLEDYVAWLNRHRPPGERFDTSSPPAETAANGSSGTATTSRESAPPDEAASAADRLRAKATLHMTPETQDPVPASSPPSEETGDAAAKVDRVQRVFAGGDDLVSPPLEIGPPTDSLRSRIKRRRTQRWPLPVSIVCGLLLLCVAALLHHFVSDDADERPASPRLQDSVAAATGVGPRSPSASASATSPDAHEPADSQQVDRALWVSPTDGEPLDSRYLPLGTRLLLALRPAKLLEHAEGRRLLLPLTRAGGDVDCLGPLGRLMREGLPAWCGIALEDMDQVLLTPVETEQERTQLSAVVRTRFSLPTRELLSAWGDPAPAENGLFVGESLGYYVPREEGNRLFVIGPREVVREIVAMEGAEPPLKRQMESLLRDSDANRHVTLLMDPYSLFADHRDAIFVGEAALLSGPVDWLLRSEATKESQGELPQAVLGSLHLAEDHCYVEVRMMFDAGRSPTQLARQTAERIASIPSRVQQYVAALELTPYTSEILRYRYPRMVEELAAYTRTAGEDEQVVVNAVLPAVAAHNLALGIHLSLLELPAAEGTRPSSPPVDTTAVTATTIHERLQKKITLTFPRETLETALGMLAESIGADLVILGEDLRIQGITKNQSFASDEHDQPAIDVLHRILLKASPAGDLVYVIRPREPAGEEVLWITTRQAAQERGEKFAP